MDNKKHLGKLEYPIVTDEYICDHFILRLKERHNIQIDSKYYKRLVRGFPKNHTHFYKLSTYKGLYFMFIENEEVIVIWDKERSMLRTVILPEFELPIPVSIKRTGDLNGYRIELKKIQLEAKIEYREYATKGLTFKYFWTKCRYPTVMCQMYYKNNIMGAVIMQGVDNILGIQKKTKHP